MKLVRATSVPSRLARPIAPRDRLVPVDVLGRRPRICDRPPIGGPMPPMKSVRPVPSTLARADCASALCRDARSPRLRPVDVRGVDRDDPSAEQAPCSKACEDRVSLAPVTRLARARSHAGCHRRKGTHRKPERRRSKSLSTDSSRGGASDRASANGRDPRPRPSASVAICGPAACRRRPRRAELGRATVASAESSRQRAGHAAGEAAGRNSLRISALDAELSRSRAQSEFVDRVLWPARSAGSDQARRSVAQDCREGRTVLALVELAHEDVGPRSRPPCDRSRS